MQPMTSAFSFRIVRGVFSAFFLPLLVLAVASAVTLEGCGGAGGGARKKKSSNKKDGKKKGQSEAAPEMEEDPTIPLEVSQELKETVLGLGAKPESHWKKAQEELENMGEEAIPGLNWGLKFPLQNLRSRACNILSRMRKSETMIPGALDALNMYPSDTSRFEAPIRRWSAKVIADLFSVYTMEKMGVAIQRDKDPGVRVILASGLGKLKQKSHISVIIRGLAEEDPQVAALAAEAFEELVPYTTRFEADGFADQPVGERKATSEKIMDWWKENYGSVKLLTADKNYDPWPMDIPVRYWKPSDDPIDPEDEREVDLNLRDAENALAQGDVREATRRFAAAYRFSGENRMDILLEKHKYWRQIGPDHADKSYHDLRDKIIPFRPHHEELWIAAARSALASGGGIGRNWARECLRMALILVPDHAEAKALMEEVGGK